MHEQPLPLEPSGEIETEPKPLQLDGFVDERSTVCIATFVDGFAAGWFFAVPEAFKASLDIQQTDRILNGRKQTIWTQGKMFSFGKGDVFYDTPEAYEYEEWQFTVKKIRLCIQIKEAVPSAIIQTKAYKTATAVNVIEDKAAKPKKDLFLLSYSRSRIHSGRVRFAVLTPTHDGKLVGNDDEVYETDQETFVCFLQTGFLRCNDGAEIDFVAKFAAPRTPTRASTLIPAPLGI